MQAANGRQAVWLQSAQAEAQRLAQLDGPLAAARRGDPEAQALVANTDAILDGVKLEAQATGQSEVRYAQANLTDPEAIRVFAWNLYEQQGPRALHDINAGAKVGMIAEGTADNWRSATAEIEPFRKDLLEARTDRLQMSNDVVRKLPPMDSNRLIPTLQEGAYNESTSSLKRFSIAYARYGIANSGSETERQALVHDVYQQYPSLAAGFLRRTVADVHDSGSGNKYVWGQILDAAETGESRRSPRDLPDVLSQLKQGTFSSDEDYLNLGIRSLTNPAEIRGFLNHYLDEHPQVATSNLKQAIENEYVAKGSIPAWKAALEQREQWDKFTQLLPEPPATMRTAFDAWFDTNAFQEHMRSVVRPTKEDVMQATGLQNRLRQALERMSPDQINLFNRTLHTKHS
jgi:hypothetical protein